MHRGVEWLIRGLEALLVFLLAGMAQNVVQHHLLQPPFKY